MTFPLSPLSHLQTQNISTTTLIHSTMAVTKTNPPPHFYTLLSPRHGKNYIVLALCRPQKDVRRRHLFWIVILLLIAALAYTLWPSDPKLKIARLRLNQLRIQFQSFPVVKVEISLKITVNLRNVDAYYMNYTKLEVAVNYRGKELGHVKPKRGHVEALTSSNVEVDLKFSGVRVLPDVVTLIEDLAIGQVPFDTVTEVTGAHGFFFFDVPLQVRTSCEVLINTNNQTIIHQTCYPEHLGALVWMIIALVLCLQVPQIRQ